jgi:hypothetical protein
LPAAPEPPPAQAPARALGTPPIASELTQRETSNPSRKEAPPAASPAQQLTAAETPVLDTPKILGDESAGGREPSPRVRSAWMPLSQSLPETKPPAAASESRPKSQAAGARPGSPQDFLKRPPRIQVESARDHSPAPESTPLSAQAPAAILKRPPRVVMERPASSERVVAKPLGDQKPSSPPPAPPQVQPAKNGDKADRSRKVQAASPARPVSEAARPAHQHVATESLPAKPAAALRQTELAQASSRPARQVPGQEKRPEGPRLSIGRLEIQIVQENPTARSAGRDGGRENAPDAWEHMDRHHLRRLGGA